jgi:hypothetical protein
MLRFFIAKPSPLRQAEKHINNGRPRRESVSRGASPAILSKAQRNVVIEFKKNSGML